MSPMARRCAVKLRSVEGCKTHVASLEELTSRDTVTRSVSEGEGFTKLWTRRFGEHPLSLMLRVTVWNRSAIPIAMFVLLMASVICSTSVADDADTTPPVKSPPAAVSSSANTSSAAAEPEAAPARSESEPTKRSAIPIAPIAPEKFRDVDDAAKLLIWLVVSCGLGLLVLLCVIVLGAKRMRRLTSSQVLKSKYDELEFLRLKHRREADGLSSPEPPKTEIR